MRILNFQLFELQSIDSLTVPEIKSDCNDILLDMQDDGFDIRFSISENNLYIDIGNYNREFTWNDISETVERILDYCKMNDIKISINGQMGLSTSSYKYFEFKNGQDILDYNDKMRWPKDLFIRVITFELDIKVYNHYK